jgi:hypothetical protein
MTSVTTLIAALEHQIDENGEDEALVIDLTTAIAILTHQTQLLASQDTLILEQSTENTMSRLKTPHPG